MNITSISRSYTPLRSSQNFGMKLSPSAEEIVNEARIAAEDYDKEYNTTSNTEELDKNLSIIKNFRPKDTLDINLNKNDFRMIDTYFITQKAHVDERYEKYEALSNGKIFYKDYFPNAFEFIRYLSRFIKNKCQAK